jgi:hypothetical protein
MPTVRPHPDTPTLHNGAIDFFADHGTAVIQYRLTPRDTRPFVEIADLHAREPRTRVPMVSPGWETLEEIAEELGPIVYPDLHSYRQQQGWRFSAVLAAAGVDAELVSDAIDDADDIETDNDWREGVEEPYDFSELPPEVNLSAEAMRICSDILYDFRGHAEVDGGLVELTDDMRAMIERRVSEAIEARLPGVFTVSVRINAQRRFFETEIRADEVKLHVLEWASYMKAHTPRGFDIAEGPHGWTWHRCDRGFEMPTVADTRQEIAAALRKGLAEVGVPAGVNIVIEPTPPTKAEARAAAWAAYLGDDARAVADLLSLTDLWPGVEAGLGLDPSLERQTWIEGWSLLERGLATRWAASVHVAASDNDDVEIPPRPPHLDRDRPA